MSAALSPGEASRIIALLGMLSSDFDGERATAGMLVSRLLKSKGLQWADLILVAPSYTPRATRAYPTTPTAIWRQQASRCLEQSNSLTPWELDFLTNICSRRALTPKQEHSLEKIVDRLACRRSR